MIKLNFNEFEKIFIAQYRLLFEVYRIQDEGKFKGKFDYRLKQTKLWNKMHGLYHSAYYLYTIHYNLMLWDLLKEYLLNHNLSFEKIEKIVNVKSNVMFKNQEFYDKQIEYFDTRLKNNTIQFYQNKQYNKDLDDEEKTRLILLDLIDEYQLIEKDKYKTKEEINLKISEEMRKFRYWVLKYKTEYRDCFPKLYPVETLVLANEYFKDGMYEEEI